MDYANQKNNINVEAYTKIIFFFFAKGISFKLKPYFSFEVRVKSNKQAWSNLKVAKWSHGKSTWQGHDFFCIHVDKYQYD